MVKIDKGDCVILGGDGTYTITDHRGVLTTLGLQNKSKGLEKAAPQQKVVDEGLKVGDYVRVLSDNPDYSCFRKGTITTVEYISSFGAICLSATKDISGRNRYVSKGNFEKITVYKGIPEGCIYETLKLIGEL